MATRTFSSLHRVSMGFRSGDWLGHSRTSMCFFLSHSFVASAVCFGSLLCWSNHPRPIFNALAGFNVLALVVYGPIHHPFYAVQLSCPLKRKTPPKHNVSTSMFDKRQTLKYKSIYNCIEMRVSGFFVVILSLTIRIKKQPQKPKQCISPITLNESPLENVEEFSLAVCWARTMLQLMTLNKV